MNKTKIEWVKNPDGTPGYTWNPITGCLNCVNGMCKGGNFPCYAYRLATTRLRERYIDNPNIALPKEMEGMDLHSEDVGEQLHDPFYPRFWPERLDEPITKWSEWGRGKMIKHVQGRKGIFVCDMSDLFGTGIPYEWTKRVMDTIKDSPTHRFYLLTKQPQNLAKFSPFPDNCWVGVTATEKTTLARGLYLGLQRIQARVKFISFEPLLAETFINMKDITDTDVNWLIIGAQTKPYKPPKIEWVEEIIQAARKAGIPVFLKDNLEPILSHIYPQGIGSNKTMPFYRPDKDGYILLRQEMPK